MSKITKIKSRKYPAKTMRWKQHEIGSFNLSHVNKENATNNITQYHFEVLIDNRLFMLSIEPHHIDGIVDLINRYKTEE